MVAQGLAVLFSYNGGERTVCGSGDLRTAVLAVATFAQRSSDAHCECAGTPARRTGSGNAPILNPETDMMSPLEPSEPNHNSDFMSGLPSGPRFDAA
jgi:hypothetical protein